MQETAIFDDLAWMDDPVPRDAALNMAVDEMLLVGLTAAGPTARPLLRVYRWDGPTISIGYFEQLHSVREAFPDRRVVRRWTGGGVVEHGDDLTYSLLVPRSRMLSGWRAEVAYGHIHHAVAAALSAAGIDRITLSGEHPPRQAGRAARFPHKCFDSPVANDVLLDGRKVAGAAQRRTRHGLLHQGSVRGQSENESEAILFRPGTALHRAVCAGLPCALGRRFETRELTASEIDQSIRLAAARYGTLAWLEKF